MEDHYDDDLEAQSYQMNVLYSRVPGQDGDVDESPFFDAYGGSPERNGSPSGREGLDPPRRQRFALPDLTAQREEQLAQIMYGAKHRMWVYVLLGLRVLPAGLSSYYNYLFSTDYNRRLMVDMWGWSEASVRFPSVLTWADNFAINVISLGSSGEQLIQDLSYKSNSNDHKYFARSGLYRAFTILGLAMVGSVPSLKMVHDAMSSHADIAGMTVPMMISQFLTNTGQNYRGISEFWQYLYPGEINKFKELSAELVEALVKDHELLTGRPLKTEVKRKLLQGRLTRDYRFKKILKGVWAVLVLPYGFVSFLSAFGFFECKVENKVLEAGCSFVKVSIAMLGMTQKVLLLTKSNWSIVEALYPNNQILASSDLRTRSERITRGVFGVVSFGVGALTLGGASESVKKYFLDPLLTDEHMATKMGLSYLIAFVAAGGINIKDFYDLFMVNIPSTYQWFKYVRAEQGQRGDVLNVKPLDILVKALRIRPRSGLSFWGIPKKPTYECPRQPAFDALLSYINTRNAPATDVQEVRQRYVAGHGDQESSRLLERDSTDEIDHATGAFSGPWGGTGDFDI